MSCKQELERIEALTNVGDGLELAKVLAEMGEEERKSILDSLRRVAAIAENVLALGYEGDVKACVERLKGLAKVLAGMRAEKRKSILDSFRRVAAVVEILSLEYEEEDDE